MRLYIKTLHKNFKKKKLQQKPMTFGEYTLLRSFGAISNHNEIMDNIDKPEKLCGRYLPADLNSMTMGTLVDVMNCTDEIKAMTIIYNVTTGQLEADRAENVLGVIKWTNEQIKTISDLFRSLERDFTADELMAGADKLQSDIFSTIDWYARRMGIQDHDEVLRVPWIKIWRCAKDDRERDEYKDRLQNLQRRKP